MHVILRSEDTRHVIREALWGRAVDAIGEGFYELRINPDRPSAEVIEARRVGQERVRAFLDADRQIEPLERAEIGEAVSVPDWMLDEVRETLAYIDYELGVGLNSEPAEQRFRSLRPVVEDVEHQLVSMVVA